MRRWAHCFRLLVILGVLFASAASSVADTIVLKNGKKIIAYRVVEEDGKVTYETSAGRLSLPKSIVDHIERGGAPRLSGSANSAEQMAISPPAIDSPGAADEVIRGTLHDGSIDREYIAHLEGEARSGSRDAKDRAALAHHAAAQFQLTQGDFERALREEQTALSFAPEQTGVLLSVAYLHLRRSEYKQALDFLDRARRLEPDSAQVAKLSGWAYYGLNKIAQAVAEWKRALALRPDVEVRAALEKAQRDQQEEENYKENESSHFTLRYSGAAEPALAREVLRALEIHFSAIESELSYTPPDPVGVILYTQEAFADITRAPGWAGAINDGRIRVPVQGLTGVTPELSRILKHELTHSFLRQKTHGRCPVWLQEGVAQWMEGQRSGEDAAALVSAYKANQSVSLDDLEGSWTRLPEDAAAYAYAWALANVEAIVQTGGMRDIIRILNHIAAGTSTEASLRAVLHSGYSDVMQSTVEYLRRAYVR